MVTAVIFSNTYWTFWDLMLFFFIWIPALMLWAFCFVDLFGRRDLSSWGKVGWLILILVIPWLGALFYLIFRPTEPAYPMST